MCLGKRNTANSYLLGFICVRKLHGALVFTAIYQPDMVCLSNQPRSRHSELSSTPPFLGKWNEIHISPEELSGSTTAVFRDIIKIPAHTSFSRDTHLCKCGCACFYASLALITPTWSGRAVTFYVTSTFHPNHKSIISCTHQYHNDGYQICILFMSWGVELH